MDQFSSRDWESASTEFWTDLEVELLFDCTGEDDGKEFAIYGGALLDRITGEVCFEEADVTRCVASAVEEGRMTKRAGDILAGEARELYQ